VAKVLEHQLCKWETFSSNPSPTKYIQNANTHKKWTRLAYKEISSKNQMKVYLAIYNKI
jgi:hypothetical protein